LLLEGADLAELMVHVRAEFGPTARIVRAERVRSGGIAGFFARERYELTIDVPDTAAGAAPTLLQRRGGVVTASGGGIDALLAAADAGDAGFGPDDALVPASDTLTRTAASPGPRVSTGQESFASVLEQMRAMAGGVAPDHHLEVAAPAVPTAPGVPGPGATARSFEPLAPAVLSGPPPAPAVPTPAPAPADAASTVAEPATSGVPRGALLDLGVPAELLGEGGPVELSRLLAGVPAAPPVPRDPGTVLVVVGPPEDAVRVAELLTLRTGSGTPVPAGDCEAVAGARRLTTPVAAQRWRAERPAADGVTVVALGVRPGRPREDAAAELLAALAPDQAWGVVDARSKRRDCTRWIATVGARRPLDALAVAGLFDTSEPGTVLGLGVPVAWIDGVPASRVAWAAALAEHLPDGTPWT
jgi:hypothetical protein